MRQLVGGVRFAQAAEAAKSVQLKPPEAAMGSTGPFSDKLQRTADYLTKVHRTRSWEEALRMWFSLFLVFRAGFSAALVCTGPAGTQRLRFRRAGSGVGAEYASRFFAPVAMASSAHKLLWHALARLRGHVRQVSYPSMAPVRAARPNPSFKRSANGRPPSPGRRYAVHFRQPGLGVLPSSPA